MPAQVNSSVITAGSLTPRSTPQAQMESRSRANTAETSTSNPQAVLASGPKTLVRSPDPGTGSQGAENQQQAPNPQNAGNGVGQNVDLSL
jgi:hypothetical protein